MMVKISQVQAKKLLEQIERVFGFYLDTTQGLKRNYEKIIDMQQYASKLTGKSIEELDLTSYCYSNDDPPSSLDQCLSLLLSTQQPSEISKTTVSLVV